MMWFEELTGFREKTPSQVRENLALDGDTLTSRVNGRAMTCGQLETPSLAELRRRVRSADRVSTSERGGLSVREVVADVQDLHADPSNAGALFQVASQFNLLEMVSPHVTPERGVGIYEHDHTQGPACAVAAGAGTIYRNYFAPVGGQVGQTEGRQIDCLADLGEGLGNVDGRLWRMQNGYALPSHSGLVEVSDRLRGASDDERDALRGMLRIGIQWGTEVTLGDAGHRVSQAYCSALPVAYASHSPDLWEAFARLVLEAAYEATVCAAVLNRRRTESDRVFLTLLGGGAFGNETEWITDAIGRALRLYGGLGLDVAIVSYGSSSPAVQELVEHGSAAR